MITWRNADLQRDLMATCHWSDWHQGSKVAHKEYRSQGTISNEKLEEIFRQLEAEEVVKLKAYIGESEDEQASVKTQKRSKRTTRTEPSSKRETVERKIHSSLIKALEDLSEPSIPISAWNLTRQETIVTCSHGLNPSEDLSIINYQPAADLSRTVPTSQNLEVESADCGPATAQLKTTATTRTLLNTALKRKRVETQQDTNIPNVSIRKRRRRQLRCLYTTSHLWKRTNM